MATGSLYELEKNLTDFITGYLEGGRNLLLIEEVCEKVIMVLGAKMIQLDALEVRPITLYIHCPGGSYRHAYYLKNIINALNSPVYGLVIGKADSIAVDILQMCQKRMMLPHATLYNHFIRTGGFKVIARDDDFPIEDAQGIRQHVLGGKRKREEFFAERTGNTVQKIQEIFRKGEDYDLTMSAEEALEVNFADEIVKDFKFFPGFKGKKEEKK